MRLYWKTKKQFIWEICKYMHNRCNSLIRSAKARYIKNNLLRSTGDPKRFGKSVNNLLKGPKREVVVHKFVDSVTGNVVKENDICDF